jgi:hypothetical protein
LPSRERLLASQKILLPYILRDTKAIKGDTPIIGDWNCDGTDDIGIYRPSLMIFALDVNGDGFWNPAVDVVLGPLGLSGDVPIIGRW